MTDKLSDYEIQYPDVLGSITRGVRVSMDGLQVALGVFPQQAYINQPIEAVLVLQNMIDQPLTIKVAFQLPKTDAKGRPMALDIPRDVIEQTLSPGEVGVLRSPIIAYPPTQPSPEVPVHVAIRYRLPRGARAIRPPAGGMTPAVINVSPFKLQALREVVFVAQSWNQSRDIITATFGIAPKTLAPMDQPLNVRYEALWTAKDMLAERDHAEGRHEDARQVALRLNSNVLFPDIAYLAQQHFFERGIQLDDGEAKAIAKTIGYTVADALVREPTFVLENTRWFNSLMHAIAQNPEIARWDASDIMADILFEPALHDAILLGFRIVQPRVRQNLGSRDERLSYAHKVMSWYAGQSEGGWLYVYMPLVMAGIALINTVGSDAENPWIMLQQLKDIYSARRRQVSDGDAVFEMVGKLLTKAQEELTRARIPQP